MLRSLLGSVLLVVAVGVCTVLVPPLAWERAALREPVPAGLDLPPEAPAQRPAS